MSTCLSQPIAALDQRRRVESGERRLLAHERRGELVAELAIGLEVRLVEELIRRRLVRKARMRGLVAQQVDRKVGNHRRLEVYEHALLPDLAPRVGIRD